jgi:hypothetical protein
MGIKFINNFITRLVKDVSSTDTVFVLDTPLPPLTAPDYFLLTLFSKAGAAENGLEIVKVTDTGPIGGTTITVQRAQEGTTAKSFTANTKVAMRLTAGAMTAVEAQPIAALARLANVITAAARSDYNKVKNIGLWTPTLRVNDVYADIPLTSVSGCVWTYSEAATLIQGSFTLNNPTSDTDYGSLKMLGFPGATFDTGYGTYASPVGYGLITNDGVTQPILLRFFSDYIIFDGASSSVVIAKGKTASFKFQAQIQHAHWGDI